MAEWLTNGRRLPDPASGVGSDPSVNEMLLDHETPARRPRTTGSDHPFPRFPNLVEDLEVNRPDQVWVTNITYVRLRKEFVCLAMLMDVFIRGIRGWHLGHSHSATHPRTQRAAAASGNRSAPPEAKAIGTLKT